VPRETRLNPAGAVHDGLAAILFSGTADADLVNDWTRHVRGKELRPDSTLIWDKAAFRKKKDLDVIARESGHHTLFLPPYSPDLSRIEPDFVNLRKIRQYAPPDTALSDIVRSYGNYSE
jgi:putative transposase